MASHDHALTALFEPHVLDAVADQLSREFPDELPPVARVSTEEVLAAYWRKRGHLDVINHLRAAARVEEPEE